MQVLSLLKGDITVLPADAIVNAANSSLMGGGGVDGAIHRAGGPTILEACKLIVARQGGCPTGQAVITTAGNLPAKHVIHTVGPVWRGGKNREHELLASCYHQSLLLAQEYNCQSVSFPCISTGVYGFPKDAAAEIAVTSIRSFLETFAFTARVQLVCFDDDNYQAIRKYIQ